jgi:GAF domain-containing protein
MPSVHTASEGERLAALRRYDILDTPSEESFDRITRLVAAWYDTPMAFITLLDEDRQWFKSCVGLDREETPRTHSFCAHNLEGAAPLVVEDARTDARFAENPLVTGPPGLRFYAGAPLVTPDGHVLGALCVADTAPRSEASLALGPLQDLAHLVVQELELRRTNAALRERSRQVEALTQDLQRAEEADRTQLSRLLQEELQQVLQAARIQLENACPDDAGTEEQRQRLAPVKAGLEDALDLTRTLAARFAPPVGNQPLRDTLDWLALKMRDVHGLSVSVLGGGALPGGDEQLKRQLYRLVRDLLYRVVQQTNTDTARVHLVETAGRLRITVEDEGTAPPNLTAETAAGASLSSLRSQMEALGGQLRVQSIPHAGTCVTLEVPRPA